MCTCGRDGYAGFPGGVFLMGVREKLNANRAPVAIGLAVILALSSHVVWRTYAGSAGVNPREAFFTADDGQSWFVESISKLPPFDRDGKEAVRAFVFRCDSDNRPFVAWMERFAPAMKSRLEHEEAERAQAIAQGKPVGAPVDPSSGMEVKKPGAGDWVRGDSALKLMIATCPDGSRAGLHPVVP